MTEPETEFKDVDLEDSSGRAAGLMQLKKAY